MYQISVICVQKFGICILNVLARIAWLSKCDFWNLWKILDRYDIFSKKQHFFFEMKIFLEKIEKLFFWEIFTFSIEKSIFSSKIFTWKNWFFYWKTQNFQLFLDFKIFKIIFLQEKKTFFDDIFFPASGDVGTSRLYAQRGLGVGRSSCTLSFIKKCTVTHFFLEDLSYEDPNART